MIHPALLRGCTGFRPCRPRHKECVGRDSSTDSRGGMYAFSFWRQGGPVEIPNPHCARWHTCPTSVDASSYSESGGGYLLPWPLGIGRGSNPILARCNRANIGETRKGIRYYPAPRNFCCSKRRLPEVTGNIDFRRSEFQSSEFGVPSSKVWLLGGSTKMKCKSAKFDAVILTHE